MAEPVISAASPTNDDDEAARSERKLARAVAIVLPIATFSGFVVTTALFGLAPGLLVMVGGTMLGVIAILWASLRVLSGDAPLAPEIEALDAGAHTVDQLAVRKQMLLRALKDLDNERALGKLEPEDHEALSSAYRAELKDVLRKMDEELAPYRKQAEELAASFLGATKTLPKNVKKEDVEKAAEPEKDEAAEADRRACAACGASNEPDAKFCKSCGKGLASDDAAAKTEDTAEKTEEKTDDAT